MNDLKSNWTDFEKSVIPVTAPAIQRLEMQKAFYAGAATCLSILLGNEEQTEQQLWDQIISLTAECKAYPLTIQTSDTSSH